MLKRIDLSEILHVHDSVRTELRDFSALIYGCDAASREYQSYKDTKDTKHLFAFVIMTGVAVEAFFNNIVEFYQPTKFKQIEKAKYSAADKFSMSISALSNEIQAKDIDGWSDLIRFITLRNKLVHNKVKSCVVKDGNLIQENNKRIDWSIAEGLSRAVFTFIFSMRSKIQWDSELLEGGKFRTVHSKVKERFDEFFAPFEKVEIVKAQEDSDFPPSKIHTSNARHCF